MNDAAYYLTFLITTAAVGLLLMAIRHRVASRRLPVESALRIYTAGAVALGLVSGLGSLPLLAALFRRVGIAQDFGHAGIAFVAAFIFNLLLGVALAGIGRIALTWKPLTW